MLEAEDGSAAMKIIEEDRNRIDLLLTDLIMPKMGGHELASKIHKKNPDLKVLFMSGYASHAVDSLKPIEKKLSFISKPFTTKTLQQKVRQVLDREALRVAD